MDSSDSVAKLCLAERKDILLTGLPCNTKIEFKKASTGLLPNYLGEQTFSDAASTALLSATSYRMAQLGLDTSTLALADTARRSVFAGVDTTTGWVAPVVDPLNFNSLGTNSPEAQAFVIVLAAAYRDYRSTIGTNAPGSMAAKSTGHSTLSNGVAFITVFILSIGLIVH